MKPILFFYEPAAHLRTEFVLRSATVVAGLPSTGRYATSRARSQKVSRSLVFTRLRDFFMRSRIVSPRVFPHYHAFLKEWRDCALTAGMVMYYFKVVLALLAIWSKEPSSTKWFGCPTHFFVL